MAVELMLLDLLRNLMVQMGLAVVIASALLTMAGRAKSSNLKEACLRYEVFQHCPLSTLKADAGFL